MLRHFDKQSTWILSILWRKEAKMIEYRKTPVIAFAVFVAAAMGDSAQAADVVVRLSDLRVTPGILVVALQTQDGFLEQGGAYTSVVPEVTAPELDVTVANIEPGAYAVTVWHDINANTVFDADEFGAPRDGWGLSGAAQTAGPPTFEAARIDVPASGLSLPVTVRYPAE
jgi:uncharacterized protein (DUF2141 family)